MTKALFNLSPLVHKAQKQNGCPICLLSSTTNYSSNGCHKVV